MGGRLRRLRLDRRLLPELLDHAGRRPGGAGRRLHPGLPAPPRTGARRPDPASGADPARRGAQPDHHRRRGCAAKGREARPDVRRSAGLDPPHRVDRTTRWRSSGPDRPRPAGGEVHGRRDPGERHVARRRVGAHPARRLAGGGRVPARRPGDQDGDVHRSDLRRSAGHARRQPRRAPLRRRPAPLLGGPQAPRAALLRRHGGRRLGRHALRSVAGRELVRARGLRSLRRALQGAS